MRMFRFLVVLIVTALTCQGVFAAEPEHASLPPDVLLQFEGRMLPPMEELERAGLAPGQTAGVKNEASEMGYITLWLNHYNALLGTFDQDLVGEAEVKPICYGDRITDQDGSPSMYRTYSTYPQIWTSYWNAYRDSDTCETIYTDQVRYFVTQVKSPSTRDARLFAGADESIAVWLNGVEVMTREGGDYEADQYQAPVHLVEGWNLILVKVYYPLIGPSDHLDYESKAWSLRLTDASGANPLHLVQNIDGWCDHEQSYNWVYAGGAADLPGAFGSQWASDLRLTNPHHFPLELTVEYYEEGSADTAPTKSAARASGAAMPDVERTIVLDPFESRTYRQVLTSLLGVTPPQKGMLAIRGYYYWDAQNNGMVELKTYNQGGGGSFGTVIPMTNLYAGYTCCSQVLHGLRNGVDFRTNIGMAPRRVFDDEIEFKVSIWDSTTGAFAQKDFVGRGSFQLNDIFAKLGLGNLETDTAMVYVSWNSTGSDARFRFFASVVDNHTSDPVDVGPGVWVLPPPLQ